MLNMFMEWLLLDFVYIGLFDAAGLSKSCPFYLWVAS